jgi:hypothetical protein
VTLPRSNDSPVGRRRSRAVGYGVAALWLVLLVVATGWGTQLAGSWSAWSVAFWAVAVWGVNLLLLYYAVGPPFAFSRIAMLSIIFAFLMTVVGSGSYWATTQRFPLYRVFIERAALFVAVCTFMSLIGCIAAGRLAGFPRPVVHRSYVWNWGRLRALTYALFALCALGTYMSIRRIGYIPLFVGDPQSLRVLFPAVAGIWLRFSALGVVVGLIAGAQICARQATRAVWLVGAAGLICASLYGNRFFAALPVGAVVMLWDQVRARVSMRAVAVGLVVGVPILALVGWWRQQDVSVALLGPLGMILYGSLGEFRDLGWTLDYYSGAHPLLHGSTLGGLVVPLLPSPIWSVVGVDKAAVFAHSNAAVLAQEMGQFAAQRVGIYGELFMNFGWAGAFTGALMYGALVGYLDRRFLAVGNSGQVRGVMLAVIGAATIYAQVGQWNMLTSTITGFCYPIVLVALFAARRVPMTA